MNENYSADLLAETLMSLAKMNQNLKDDILTEKFYRDNAERDNKKAAEERDKFRNEVYKLQSLLDKEKESVKFLQGEIDAQKTVIIKLKKRLKK